MTSPVGRPMITRSYLIGFVRVAFISRKLTDKRLFV
ncbi:hypothetical protein J2S25_001730 [Mesobacillus stamsii]|uniref:Uncharacterized protein n=1 Tax=Mesobacillus stamsii TaxID=225347 RepID=A0ABU0FUB8_9BACI|nr:hypothetical protein [Mesobacillus stamsii]